MKRIGKIYACIAGDHRYGTTIEVRASDTRVEVHLVSTSPVGGMDGPGGTHDRSQLLMLWDTSSKLSQVELIAPLLIAYLRRAFKEVDSGTIATYGKPTKNFTWYGDVANVKGFSIALAKAALKGLG